MLKRERRKRNNSKTFLNVVRRSLKCYCGIGDTNTAIILHKLSRITQIDFFCHRGGIRFLVLMY